MVMVMIDFDDLKRAVESEHGGTAARLQSVPVIEKRLGLADWEGVVHIFSLLGHPNASKAYAWWSMIEGSNKRRYFTMLHMGAITCSKQAVAAANADEQTANDNGH
jgi:hypothetical protein